jgi:hypothetical protein
MNTEFVTFRKTAIRSGWGGNSYHWKLQVLFKIFLPELIAIQDKITHTRNEVCHPKCDSLWNIISTHSNGGTKNKQQRISFTVELPISAWFPQKLEGTTMTLLLKSRLIWGHLIRWGNVCQCSCHSYLITVQANTLENNDWVQTNNISKTNKTIGFSHLLDCNITRCKENRTLAIKITKLSANQEL